MNKLKYCILMLTIFLSVIFPCAFAHAETVIDWESVDWVQFDMELLNEDNELLGDLRSWLYNQASAESLIEASKAKWDGAFSTMYANALGFKFIKEPIAILSAMATIDKDSHEQIARLIAGSEAYLENDVDIVRFLAELQLPADAKAERAMLNKIIDYAEQYYGIDIPRTGDPIAMALAALLLSGTGLFVVVSKKKQIA